MSDLSDFHQRITAAFSSPKPGVMLRGQVRETADPGTEVAPAQTHGPWRNPLWLALGGLGLLGSATVLGIGIPAGYPMTASLLAVAGIAGTALLVKAPRVLPSVRTAPLQDGQSELAEDRRWERQESAQVLSSLHDMLGDIAVVRDGNGRIIEANAVLRRLSGCDEPEGRTCEEVGIVFTETPNPRQFRAEIGSGPVRHLFDWHDVIAREPLTGNLRVHSIARDITEAVLSLKENEEARLRAEQASEGKSRLLATVSHEIRTPLSGILGMSHLLGQTRLTGEQKNYVAGLGQSGHSLVQLVEDLLDFASIEAGRFKLSTAHEPLRETIESVVEMLSHRAHTKGIEIGSSVDADVPMLLAFDSPRLRQVLFNVIGNAVKFTRVGGVLVRAGIEQSDVIISVEDSGPGMSGSDLTRIFEDFVQAGPARQGDGSTGLGLGIARRIITEFGGTLKATSVIGQGSRFEIRFPVSGATSGSIPAERTRPLTGSHLLVLAPIGPAARALALTVETLGGSCRIAGTVEDARSAADQASAAGEAISDVIVDHRHASQLRRLLTAVPSLRSETVRKTYLLNPEERQGRAIGQTEGYHAWLIRPLREKSLVSVLRGTMRGMEVRDAINDNRPTLRDLPALLVGDVKAEVLLAEDDPVNAMMVRCVLEKAGYPVRLATDYTSLADTLFSAPSSRHTAPDILVTDLNMPGGDGHSLIRRIRASEPPSHRRMPVIVVTSDVSTKTVRSLTLAGADLVLAKPADPTVLLAEIERLTGRRDP